jgi:hypothetical protein
LVHHVNGFRGLIHYLIYTALQLQGLISDVAVIWIQSIC